LMENSILRIFGSVQVQITPDCLEIRGIFWGQ
jgi:hypothetical protein